MVYVPTEPVTTLDELRALLPPPHPDQQAKIIDRIDPLCAAWIAQSTFVTLATTAADGTVEISPKGDPAGFVHVLDAQTLALPDRPGNHRFDSFQNIFATGQVGLMFLVPHRNEVLRVTGRAVIVRDPELCARLAINGRPAGFAVVVTVKRVFFHCGKAIIRSALWKAGSHPVPQDLPTYAEALAAHAQVSEDDFEALDARLAHNDAHRLYDE